MTSDWKYWNQNYTEIRCGMLEERSIAESSGQKTEKQIEIP